MRPVRVVVGRVLGQHVHELPLVEDQHLVQAFAADGAHPPLGVGVGLRRTRRTTQYGDADVGEHGIEAGRELRVAIADQEPEAVSLLPQREHEVAGLLSHCATKPESGHDLWYSGKHHRHGGNVQVLTGPDGYPEWVSDAEPGSTHDITAARIHALPALYPAAAAGLRTLADKGYTGAGIGVLVPIKGANLAPDNRTRNTVISALRAPAERANALLKRTWKTLERVTLDPNRIGQIAAAALVLLHLQRPTR